MQVAGECPPYDQNYGLGYTMGVCLVDYFSDWWMFLLKERIFWVWELTTLFDIFNWAFFFMLFAEQYSQWYGDLRMQYEPFGNFFIANDSNAAIQEDYIQTSVEFDVSHENDYYVFDEQQIAINELFKFLEENF